MAKITVHHPGVAYIDYLSLCKSQTFLKHLEPMTQSAFVFAMREGKTVTVNQTEFVPSLSVQTQSERRRKEISGNYSRPAL